MNDINMLNNILRIKEKNDNKTFKALESLILLLDDKNNLEESSEINNITNRIAKIIELKYKIKEFNKRIANIKDKDIKKQQIEENNNYKEAITILIDEVVTSLYNIEEIIDI